MLDIVGLRLDQMPQIFESYEVVGKIKESVASLLELRPDVKGIAGGGDQAVCISRYRNSWPWNV